LPRLHLVVPAVLLLSGLVVAQSSDRVEVFGGYTYLNLDFSLVSPNHVNGWNASANFKVRPWLGFVADFSGFYPSYFYPGCGGCSQGTTISGTSYTFLFGPQFSLRRGRFVPFARFLLGDSHVSPTDIGGTSYNTFRSNNALSLALGGGLDYSVTRRIAIRGQADWLYTWFTPKGGGDPGVNYVQNRSAERISTGVVFRF
jgi:opacity protein-like surface antigen